MDTNRAIVALDRLRETDEPRAGGKAFNCARLRQAGFPVPDGMVVMATAGDTEIAAVPEHAWLSTIPADVVFAVRSSGIGEDGTGESFAGIHQTLLNVARADLAAAVAACRASAHGREALEYRRVMKMPVDTIQMGVLIQRMVHPMAAGVAFSVKPGHRRRRRGGDQFIVGARGSARERADRSRRVRRR
jgi:phosphoenolpyruvate synthase/pyruvate phosphate dikinase